jgi:Uroporphyrinogen decarboxylase (URO-D)
MGKEWSELSADEKMQQRFHRWLSPNNVDFVSPEAEVMYKERVTRLIDTITLKEPDRVPVVISPAHVPARYSGYTVKEIMYDSGKLVNAWEKYVNDFEHDVLPSAGLVRCGKALDILDSKTLKWPGHGLPDNLEPQFVEGEHVKGDEWGARKKDPSDFQMRTYLPRVYGAAEAFKKLPPLSLLGGYSGGLTAFADPDVQAAFKALGESGKAEAEWNMVIAELDGKGIASGLPKFSGSICIAPLDGVGAGLRGTKGTIMDMFKQPERLIEYMEEAVPGSIRGGIALADMSGVPVAFIPMHRGADGFMSEDQFITFYWTYLKRVVLGLIEDGIVPHLFAEGGYNSRLEIIKDLPKGKVIWHFDQTDMIRAKKVLGGRACIMGNVPTSLMITGNKQEVKARCRELIETAGKGGGYILAPGASADQSKIENINALLESAREYGVYKK